MSLCPFVGKSSFLFISLRRIVLVVTICIFSRIQFIFYHTLFRSWHIFLCVFFFCQRSIRRSLFFRFNHFSRRESHSWISHLTLLPVYILCPIRCWQCCVLRNSLARCWRWGAILQFLCCVLRERWLVARAIDCYYLTAIYFLWLLVFWYSRYTNILFDLSVFFYYFVSVKNLSLVQERNQ